MTISMQSPATLSVRLLSEILNCTIDLVLIKSLMNQEAEAWPAAS